VVRTCEDTSNDKGSKGGASGLESDSDAEDDQVGHDTVPTSDCSENRQCVSCACGIDHSRVSPTG
jgi:hypothetical protein